MGSFLLFPCSSGRKVLVFLLLLLVLSSVVWADISAEIAAIRDKVVEVACYILVIIEGIVGFLAVLMFTLAALKWIISDNAEDRAEVKEKLANILIGVVIVILALELANVIGVAVGIIDAHQPCSWADAILKTQKIRDIIGGPICIIVRVFQFLFALIGMIVFMAAGIMWMTSEDPDERVKSRSMAINVLAGILLVLIGLNLLNFLFSWSGISYESALDTLLTFTCAGYDRLDIGKLGDVAQYTVCMVLLIIKGIAGVIAVLMVAVAGILLIIAEDSSTRNKAKSLAFAAVVGAIIVIIGSQFLVDLFSPTYSSGLSWTCASGTESDIIDLINYTLCTVKNVLVAVAGLIATIALIASAFIWITSGSPEARASAKYASIVAIMGLIVAIVGLQYLGTVFGGSALSFTCGVGVTPSNIVSLVENVLCIIYNVLRSVVAVVAAIMVLFGGFMFISSDSDRDRARGKNMVAAAIIGFIIALIAIQFIQAVVTQAGMGVSTCDDAYKLCVDDCIDNHGEPSPIPGGGGGTTTTTATTTTTGVTTTTLSCIQVCAAVGSCGDAPYACGQASYCMVGSAGCDISVGIPGACTGPTFTLTHTPAGDAWCEAQSYAGPGYQCCCCP